MADGTPARVVDLDAARTRRASVRRTRVPTRRAAGVELLTDAELDDELAAHAMGFPVDYQLPPQRCHATQMLGNAIVPAVAASAVRACMEAVS